MLHIPSEISSAYDCLLSQRALPRQQWSYHKKWLRFYLDFCHKYKFDTEHRASAAPIFYRWVAAIVSH